MYFIGAEVLVHNCTLCKYRSDLYESEKPLESTSLTKAQSNTSPERVLKVFPAGQKQTGGRDFDANIHFYVHIQHCKKS